MTDCLSQAEFSALLIKHAADFIIDHQQPMPMDEAKMRWERGEGVHVEVSREGCFTLDKRRVRGVFYYLAELPPTADPSLRILLRTNAESRLPWNRK